MSHSPLPDDLDPSLVALLHDEASRPDPPAAEKAAAWEALQASLAAGALGGVAAKASSTTSGAPSGAALGAGKLLAAVALFGAGVGAGAALHATLASPKVVVEERTVTVVASAPSPTPSFAAPAAPVPSVRAPAVSVARSAATSSTLHDERLVLEIATAALARGDGLATLAATDRHAREFPRGQLAEEREALAIQGLAAAGRGADARARAGRFEVRFPDSPFAPAVQAAVR